MRKISSFALFAFILPLAGCPGDDTGETDAMATTTMTPATDTVAETDPTAAEPTAGETDPTAGETVDPTAADTTAGGGGAGFCGQTCAAVADCVPPMGNEADYACTDGFCEFVGTPLACDDTTCPAAIGGACADVGGVNQCTFPCTDGGTECDALGLMCTGMDDAGNPICAAPPCGGVAEGEPCEIPMFGQIGTCTDGVCSCSDDSECTAEGFACNN